MKNLDLYRPQFISSNLGEVRVGVVSNNYQATDERLLYAVLNSLRSSGFKVTYPYYSSATQNADIDFLITADSSSNFEGSGWNFLINWPGFVVWTPAWHGYNYRAYFRFDFDITDVKTGNQLPHISIPIDLDLRHAAINRTWTEISWLEWSVIAFVGGILFTRYDHTVTPLLLDRVENKIGNYAAGKLTNVLIAAQPKVTVDPLAVTPAVRM